MSGSIASSNLNASPTGIDRVIHVDDVSTEKTWRYMGSNPAIARGHSKDQTSARIWDVVSIQTMV
jgi:hypothetical protein